MVIWDPQSDYHGGVHGKKTGNKIPRGQEIQHHKVSLETRLQVCKVEHTPHLNYSQTNGSGARKEADHDKEAGYDKEKDPTRRLRKETSQSNRAGDGVHQPEHAYLGIAVSDGRAGCKGILPGLIRLPAGG